MMKKIHSNLNVKPFSIIHENSTLNNDMLSCIVWEYLWSWVSRAVYVHALDETKVIKLEWADWRCNIQEEIIYNQVQWLEWSLARVKDWFAPIYWVSPLWKVLCMARTTPHEESWKKDSDLPKKVPSFLWDVKIDNFWRYKWKFVCHDYSTLYWLMEYSKKMKDITRK